MMPTETPFVIAVLLGLSVACTCSCDPLQQRRQAKSAQAESVDAAGQLKIAIVQASGASPLVAAVNTAVRDEMVKAGFEIVERTSVR